MLLKNKIAIIHGGAGSIGGAVARVFAREGATVYLTGRTRSKLEVVAEDIRSRGGKAELEQLDALDERAVQEHADGVCQRSGRIDIEMNAIGVMHIQGKAFLDQSLDDLYTPVEGFVRSNFITAQAAARHMVKQRSGVILTLSTPGSRMSASGFLGYGVTCAAVEGFSRILAGELGMHEVRVVCLRSHAIPEALPTSYAGEVFALVALQQGTTAEAMLAESARTGTLLGRLPTLNEVAEDAAFLASDRAGATTGAIANLTSGAIVD
ncbi:MAG: SDR family oxidoreductase [Flavobacteriales bacterium]|nr:SDR family oxidoreductase [Flavobacteriales bacterium]